MNIGDKVILIAKTRHGKNRLNQHGNPWKVLGFDGSGRSRRVRLESPNETFSISKDTPNVKDVRWVDLEDDRDFDFE